MYLTLILMHKLRCGVMQASTPLSIQHPYLFLFAGNAKSARDEKALQTGTHAAHHPSVVQKDHTFLPAKKRVEAAKAPHMLVNGFA